MAKCPICGEPAVVRAGGPCLCDKHLEEQRPLVEAWHREVKLLVAKHVDAGLYEGYMWSMFRFLMNSINEIYTNREFGWWDEIKELLPECKSIGECEHKLMISESDDQRCGMKGECGDKVIGDLPNKG